MLLAPLQCCKKYQAPLLKSKGKCYVDEIFCSQQYVVVGCIVGAVTIFGSYCSAFDNAITNRNWFPLFIALISLVYRKKNQQVHSVQLITKGMP